MGFPMKFGYCLLTLPARERVQFEEAFSSPFPCVIKANAMPYMLGSPTITKQAFYTYVFPVDFGSTFHK